MTTAPALPELALSRRVFVAALGGAVGGLMLGLRLVARGHAPCRG